MDADIIIVGAGAAGLWAAGTAAARGRRVLVLEKTPRAGSKVLASGGTRCNLTTTLGPEAAARLFGAGERFVQPAFRALPPERVRAIFAELGVPTVEEPELEKVFPASQRAMDVRDALLRRAKGAVERYRSPVRGVEPHGGAWVVHTTDGQKRAPKLILCPGGRSYPATGTTGDGYRWLAELGLAVVPPVPALVPLSSGAEWVRELSGISFQQVEARLLDGEGRVLGRRARPVLFTHTGVSGPGAMDLSAHVARAAQEGRLKGWSLALDLLPHRAEAGLRAQILGAQPGAPHLARFLGEELPSRVLAAVCAQAGVAGDNPALASLDRARRNRLVDALKGLRIPISGTLGWDKAEVTAGGLALDELSRTTMELRRHPGLYVAGELLDLSGPIGGLSFQAAFATAELAAAHAAG